MKTRIQLHEKLLALFGSYRIYFQPPPTIKMEYPAIVYVLSDAHQLQADNTNYRITKRYTLTFIHRDPDIDLMDDMLSAFELCSFDRRFVNDNLYHDVYSLYY